MKRLSWPKRQWLWNAVIFKSVGSDAVLYGVFLSSFICFLYSVGTCSDNIWCAVTVCSSFRYSTSKIPSKKKQGRQRTRGYTDLKVILFDHQFWSIVAVSSIWRWKARAKNEDHLVCRTCSRFIAGGVLTWSHSLCFASFTQKQTSLMFIYDMPMWATSKDCPVGPF